MPISQEAVDALELVRRKLEEAEEEHPFSPSLKKLHLRMYDALANHGAEIGMSQSQIDIVMGGTPKTPPE